MENANSQSIFKFQDLSNDILRWAYSQLGYHFLNTWLKAFTFVIYQIQNLDIIILNVKFWII